AYPYYAFPDAVNEMYWNLSEHAGEQLREMVKTHAWNGTHPEVVVQTGMVADSILSFAAKQTVDLIVMGTHGRRGIDRLTMGSVTERVLRKAQCPVLAVRNALHDFVTVEKGKEQGQVRKISIRIDLSETTKRTMRYESSLS